MTTVLIDKDEWCPVFTIDLSYGVEAQLTDAEISKVQAALAAFEEAQEILRAAWAKSIDAG